MHSRMPTWAGCGGSRKCCHSFPISPDFREGCGSEQIPLGAPDVENNYCTMSRGIFLGSFIHLAHPSILWCRSDAALFLAGGILDHIAVITSFFISSNAPAATNSMEISFEMFLSKLQYFFLKPGRTPWASLILSLPPALSHSSALCWLFCLPRRGRDLLADPAGEREGEYAIETLMFTHHPAFAQGGKVLRRTGAHASQVLRSGTVFLEAFCRLSVSGMSRVIFSLSVNRSVLCKS